MFSQYLGELFVYLIKKVYLMLQVAFVALKMNAKMCPVLGSTHSQKPFWDNNKKN